jgi:hypothetical protein
MVLTQLNACLDPWKVYGCHLPSELVVALPWLLTVVFTVVSLYLMDYLSTLKERLRRRTHTPEAVPLFPFS